MSVWCKLYNAFDCPDTEIIGSDATQEVNVNSLLHLCCPV
jgi:hypothetical protein